MEKLGCKNLLHVIGGYLHTVTAATNILVIFPQGQGVSTHEKGETVLESILTNLLNDS